MKLPKHWREKGSLNQFLFFVCQYKFSSKRPLLGLILFTKGCLYDAQKVLMRTFFILIFNILAVSLRLIFKAKSN